VTSTGFDASHYQGTINWPKVKADGVPFALHKVNEGTDPALIDPNYPANRAGALAVGVPFGGYHWCHTTTDPAAAAVLFAQHLGQVPGMLPPFADLEVDDGRTPAQIHTWLQGFFGHYAKPIGVYTYTEFWNAHVAPAAGGDQQLATRPLWLARYSTAMGAIPAPWREVAIWQDSDHGSIDGITGPVDLDLLVSESLPQLVAFAAGLPLTPPPPTPTQGDPMSLDDTVHRLDQLAAGGALDNVFKRFLTIHRDLYGGQGQHNELAAIKADADTLVQDAAPAAHPGASSVTFTSGATFAPEIPQTPPAPAPDQPPAV